MNIKLERAMWKLEERLYPIVPKPLKIILKKRDVQRYSYRTVKVLGEWYLVEDCSWCGKEVGKVSVRDLVESKQTKYSLYCTECDEKLSNLSTAKRRSGL